MSLRFRLHRLRSALASRAFVVFLLAVVAPGLLVGFFGWRSLQADAREARRAFDDRLDNVGDRLLSELENEFHRWASTVGEAAAQPPNARLPLLLAGPASAPFDAALIEATDGLIVVRSSARLSYRLDGEALDAPAAPSPGVAKGEQLELKGDHAAAAALYEALLVRSPTANRSEILLRLARSLKDAGRPIDALKAYDSLARTGSARVGSLPAELVGRYEVCAMTPPGAERAVWAVGLYRDLAVARWSLTHWSYAFYVERVGALRDELAQEPAGWAEAREMEAGRRALTEAAQRAVEWSRPAGAAGESVGIFRVSNRLFFGFSQRLAAHPGARLLFVVAAPALFAKRLSAVADGLCRQDDVRLRVADEGGAQVFAAGGDGEPVPGTVRKRDRQIGDSRWTAEVAPRGPGAVDADLARRRRVYVAMLVAVIVSLGAAGALTVRAVSKDMEVARLKSQFVSAVSHEFRTPLAGIRQFAEMLVNDRIQDDDRRRRYLRRILGASERLSRLVDNVLDFARIEEGRQTYTRAAIETTAWLRQTVAEFQDTLPPDRFVEAVIPEELPGISGDADALGRAIQNLLDNAVKYSPNEPVVWLDAGVEPDGIRIAVRDRGVGVSDADRPRLFDRFFRGAALAQTVGGAGLGLSLVHHVVSAHGGTVSVESAPGRGSMFTVRLPV